ncbi:MAG TPA: agmatine deiminase family protein [Polyangiales bacterium]|jgi:agmatine deiminase|nr:agmatine deiminase family protein [Polyangiales bacterium]
MVSASALSQTPRSAGYMQPAEWAPHRGCYTAWPAHEYAWGAALAAAQKEFVGFATAFCSEREQEPLSVLVDDDAHEAEARSALAECGERIVFKRVAYGDVWLRDTAPIFVRDAKSSRIAAVRFRFNGWGEKYIYPHDAELSGSLAAHHGGPVFRADFVLEGGALDVDGLGTCLTTRSCLLNPNREAPSGPEAEPRIGARLSDMLGIDKLIWVDAGLQNDHTDGHIDNIARFVAPGVVVCMQAHDADDVNAQTLDEIAATLSAATDARGQKLRVVRVPSPGRVLGSDGNVVPASYMNFIIGNRVVVVPGFGTKWDGPAREALAALFPDRVVRMQSARAILEGGGTFHCMTQQVPAP